MFIRLGEGREPVPLARLIPNVLTTLALCCGLASLHFIWMEQWEKALAAIVLSGIFDVLDGAAARLLRVSSRFGAVLDSLSDFLAFGIAPALILEQWVLADKHGKLIDTLSLVAAMVFALCAALRLARFTAGLGPTSNLPEVGGAGAVPAVSTPPVAGKRPGLFFTGMPTPAGAGVVLIPAFLRAADQAWFRPPEWAIAIFTLVVALLMVSRVPMFALKGVRVPRRLVAPVLVLLGVLAILMTREPWLVLAGIAAFYAATIPWAWMLSLRSKARAGA